MRDQTPAPLVLLADDNVDAAETLGTLMELMGFEVQVCADGAAAAHAAATRMPLVAILDLGMPGLDGWEVCRRIRALPGGGDVKIAALSGWGSEQARTRCLEVGFDAHWTKPAEINVLIALLQSAVSAAAHRGLGFAEPRDVAMPPSS